MEKLTIPTFIKKKTKEDVIMPIQVSEPADISANRKKILDEKHLDALRDHAENMSEDEVKACLEIFVRKHGKLVGDVLVSELERISAILDDLATLAAGVKE